MKPKVEITLSQERVLEIILKQYFGEEYTEEHLKGAKINFLKEGNSIRVEEIKINL
jgi:hypothetical protein